MNQIATTRFLPHHVDDLRQSGISIDTALANGIHSESDNNVIAQLLGWSRATKLGSCLVIPICCLDGTLAYHRIKPDNPRLRASDKKPIKYESPKGVTSRIYIPVDVRDLANIDGELLITEGEKKALAATQHGFPCVGIFGVHNWKQKNCSALIPCFKQFNLKDRRVVIVFDSDITSNEQILHAEQWLAHHLQNEGAIVRVVRLPDAPDGSKQGVDDLIVKEGPGKLRRLVDAAEPPDAPDPDIVKASLGSALPESVADEYLETVKRDGTLALRCWNGSFWRWSGGKYHELTDSDVSADLVRRLRETYCQIKRGDVNNVLLNVAAGCAVISTAQPPRWLDGGDEAARTWRPSEVFCTKSHIIHLPGLIERRSDAVAATSPKFFNLVASDYDFDPNAPLPSRWLQFLDELWGSDLESVEMLRQWFGYMLTPDTSHQKILLLVGPKRSGKGTIAQVLRSIIGDANCCAPTLASLTTNFGLSVLLGKTAAIIGDARLSGRTDVASTTERLLSISGEDAVTVDRKYKDPVTRQLSTRFTIISNELPHLNDASGALASRLLILRLTESFYGDEDLGLLDALIAERQSILLWAIGGWKLLRDAGRFTSPSNSQNLVEQMECLGSPIKEFVEDRYELDASESIALDDLYEDFQQWCEQNGTRSIPPKNVFSRDLSAAFPQLSRKRSRVDGTKTTTISGLRYS